MVLQETRLLNGAVQLSDPTWKVRHGFLGKPVDASDASLKARSNDICGLLDVEALLLVRQVHGDSIVYVDKEPGDSGGKFTILAQADAIVVNTEGFYPCKTLAFCVRTADCIPVLIKTKHHLAIVHSGWRGLEAQVALKSLRMISQREKSLEAEVLIGPCAGAGEYEVGQEVLGALQPYTVAGKNGQRWCLDLAATLSAQLKEYFGQKVLIKRADVCTITSHDYYSHRRNPQDMGRNLAYFVIPRS